MQAIYLLAFVMQCIYQVYTSLPAFIADRTTAVGKVPLFHLYCTIYMGKVFVFLYQGGCSIDCVSVSVQRLP